ncbi:GNAT family N-acetyltransferase [Virgibacillus sp. LDC-1]|uniref:GNAT family N-acetyltransferase n=1 Tax=Virgibacillus sp. LDC-1 TaxID=3039856 RepID=UPI0024DE3B5F|nr:GNAT family N-acetyltransferase [Virgibacillus sp. LDC-1]
MNRSIDIRRLHSLEELNEMQQIEEQVWEMPPTPVHQTYTACNNGGILLGAYDENRMIGFLYSFAGFDGSAPYVCSHMLGILPAYQKLGVGMRMKLEQARIAKDLGYHMITWTYDPLETKNAYLNIHKLGAAGVQYKEDHYGTLDDGLNQGLATDRFLVAWHLHKEPIKKEVHEISEHLLLLKVGENDQPAITDTFNSANLVEIECKDGWFVAVPDHFQQIKQRDLPLAKAWRSATRRVFMALFSNGYMATDIIRDKEQRICYYYFSK